MIIKIFDNGWGNNYPLKRFEQDLVDQMLRSVSNDDSRTIVINSVWYTGDYHEQVMSWLRTNEFDRLILVAMIDAAIPHADWYQEFDITTLTLGYYPGANYLDYWALFVDRFYEIPDRSQLMDPFMIDAPFMCLNRKPHWHRKRLYAKLVELGLDRRGFVTMGSETGVPVKSIDGDVCHRDLAPNSGPEHYGIPNDIVSLGRLDIWQRCFLNVVTETVFDINRNGFVSEKIYKPIVGYRPFLVYDTDGAGKWLTDRGFQHYMDDFRDISDLDLSISSNLPGFLQILSDQESSYFQKKFLDLREKISYNKNRFERYVQDQHDTLEKGIQCPI